MQQRSSEGNDKEGEVVMKKHDVNKFHRQTAEYVVMHARWQRSRGRNESESYRSERNPRKAVALALKDLESYEPRIGESINVAANNMASRAKLVGKPCKAHFNGILIEAIPGVDPAYTAATYKAESHRQAIAY